MWSRGMVRAGENVLREAQNEGYLWPKSSTQPADMQLGRGSRSYISIRGWEAWGYGCGSGSGDPMVHGSAFGCEAVSFDGFYAMNINEFRKNL